MREIECIVCGRRVEASHGSRKYCGPCSNPKIGKPLAHKAREIAALARRTGKLPSFEGVKCVNCGEPATQYDHRDYRKPLEVEPVCRLCNNRRGPGKPYRGRLKKKAKVFFTKGAKE